MKKTILLAALLSIAGCSKIDDYMLGKDNTPAPEALKPLDSKVKLTENWSVSTGLNKKNTANLKLKPQIVGDIVYIADASGVVQAIKTGTGTPVWSTKLSASVISGPEVSNEHVIVGTDNSKIVTLDRSSGKEVWQNNLSSDMLAKPVAARGQVIAKTIDGNLYSFDAKSGQKRWVSEHGAPSLILKAGSSPVILDNKMALVGYSDGKMDAVDLETGSVLWQRSIAYASGASDVERLVDIDADPVVQGGVALLASYQGYVGALSLNNGEFVWRKPASTFTNFVVHDNELFMADSQDIIWAMNKYTGQVSWKQPALKARGLTEPVLVGDLLVVGDKTGMLHILSTRTGEFVSRKQLGAPITIAPGVAGKNLYVMTANGKLSRISVS